jgi:hypothetical protein
MEFCFFPLNYQVEGSDVIQLYNSELLEREHDIPKPVYRQVQHSPTNIQAGIHPRNKWEDSNGRSETVLNTAALGESYRLIAELNQQQQQCLPQLESFLDGHLSRHFLPAPFRLEIENTT